MRRPWRHRGWMLPAALLCVVPAWAHVGSKDVFQQVTAGPYKLFVTLRPPTVIPGLAGIEVRALKADGGGEVSGVRAAALPLMGMASRLAPVAEPLQRSGVDRAFFSGSVWLMTPGSWQVRFEVDGTAGVATAAVPVPAVALSMLPMKRGLGWLLTGLAGMLTLWGVSIVAGAVREAQLGPDDEPDAERKRRARVAGGFALLAAIVLLVGGDRWWKVEARGYAGDLYHPLRLRTALAGDVLTLTISMGGDSDTVHVPMADNDLLPDHGHLMHLYAIRWPEMDAAFHLHPELVSGWTLRETLPKMPVGQYRLFADIVHANGFPETLTATIAVPSDMNGGALEAEDAEGFPAGVSAGELGAVYRLPDGYSMVWDKPASLTASVATEFRFKLLDASGQPAGDMQPYLGMAGHAAFVKVDGTVFAHTHPEGSAAMPAVMLANPDSMEAMPGMAAPVVGPVVAFPYGFPTAGRYRIFVQMKHGVVVETGVFDAEVHDFRGE